MNLPKLKGKITEKELNVVKVAEYLENTPKTLYKKLREDRLTCKDAAKIIKLLGISDEEAIEIFLS